MTARAQTTGGPTVREARTFGVGAAALFAVVGLLAAWRGWGTNLDGVLFAVAGASAVTALVTPAVWRPVRRGWYAFAHALGWFNLRLICAVAYVLMLVPMSLVMRLARQDPLERVIERDRLSYWRQRDPLPDDRDSYLKPY